MARLPSIALLLAGLTCTSAYAAYDVDAGSSTSYVSAEDVSVIGADGWYFSVAGGVAKMSNNLETVAPVVQNGFERLAEINGTSYKLGWDLAGAIGYKSGPVRYEAEFTYIDANAKGFSIDGVDTLNPSGDTHDGLGLLNIYYDFDDTGMSFVPFLGAGLGMVRSTARMDGFVTDEFGFVDPLSFTISENIFAYQATIGMLFNISNNSSVSLAYRYVASTSGKEFGKRMQVQLGNIGFLYRFDQT
jgi:opacity protein-like surface antigen